MKVNISSLSIPVQLRLAEQMTMDEIHSLVKNPTPVLVRGTQVVDGVRTIVAHQILGIDQIEVTEMGA